MKVLGQDNIQKEHLTLEAQKIEDDVKKNKPHVVMNSIATNLKMILSQFSFEPVGIDPFIENKNI